MTYHGAKVTIFFEPFLVGEKRAKGFKIEQEKMKKIASFMLRSCGGTILVE